jgi:hypothetical protein
MGAKSLEERLTKLEKRNKELEKVENEVGRLRDALEIQNMMSTYEYLHTYNDQEAIVEMYAKNQPDVYVGKGMGYWVGKDAPRRGLSHLMEMGTTPGYMPIHPTTTPVIEVAEDRKTAKGMWIGTGFVTMPDPETGEPRATWEWDKYAIDFIKEDGKWKFWHFHLHKIWRIGWDEKWSEHFKKELEPMSIKYSDENKPDGPRFHVNDYSLKTVQHYIPAPPEPYETWDDKISYDYTKNTKK